MLKTKDLRHMGLHSGQMRNSPTRAHNGGWYNAAGEKLGWGDLTLEDLERVAGLLEPNDVFVVLPESASFWGFVTHNPGTTGAACTTDPTELSPGVDYVVEHAYLMAVDGVVHDVDRPELDRSMTQEELRAHMTAAQATP